MAQENSTKPLRIPLQLPLSTRNASFNKDARLVNGYSEKLEDGTVVIQKRPGLVVNTTGLTGNGYGVYNWKGDIYSVFGATLYKNGVSLGTVDGTGGVYSFSSSLGATPRLVLQNGVRGYTYSSGGGLAQITDVDYPATTVKGLAYLDGTTYVMDAAARIYGSDINNPTSWDPLNFLTAQIEPDGGVALAKQLTYVIALKEWTTEVFYDAANSTGSPLSPVQGSKASWGCASADTLQDIDGALFWVGTNRSGSRNVVMYDTLKMLIVSTKAVERILETATMSTVASWQFKYWGHRFYGLTLKTENITLVLDLTEKQWYIWTDTAGNYWPIAASTFTSTQGHLVQHMTNGTLYTVSSTAYNDDGVLFPVDIYTPIFDGGSKAKKAMQSLELIGDQTAGCILNMRFSDDDYQNWTNFHEMDMGLPRPILYEVGSFRRRAFHLRHLANTPLRVEALEAVLSLAAR